MTARPSTPSEDELLLAMGVRVVLKEIKANAEETLALSQRIVTTLNNDERSNNSVRLGALAAAIAAFSESAGVNRDLTVDTLLALVEIMNGETSPGSLQ